MKWHEPSEKLPKKSGEYLVAYNGTVGIFNYSKVHEAFNAYDWFEPATANLLKLNVDYWAKIPKAPKEK